MNKAKALLDLAKEIEECHECKKDTLGMAVPGEGNPDAKIAFIGEAPGKTEAETGRPFVGRSGKLLRSLIREVGLTEKEVYITSPVKRLPKKGTPTDKQITHGRKHLIKQLQVINPEIIVLLGSVAVRAILDEKLPVLKRHGEIVKKNGRNYFLTLHPAAAIRFVKFKKIIISDFAKLKPLTLSL
ncbi:MAG: uracil-DNA glycosylase [Patescibacteria group bacterium]